MKRRAEEVLAYPLQFQHGPRSMEEQVEMASNHMLTLSMLIMTSTILDFGLETWLVKMTSTILLNSSVMFYHLLTHILQETVEENYWSGCLVKTETAL